MSSGDTDATDSPAAHAIRTQCQNAVRPLKSAGNRYPSRTSLNASLHCTAARVTRTHHHYVLELTGLVSRDSRSYSELLCQAIRSGLEASPLAKGLEISPARVGDGARDRAHAVDPGLRRAQPPASLSQAHPPMAKLGPRRRPRLRSRREAPAELQRMLLSSRVGDAAAVSPRMPDA